MADTATAPAPGSTDGPSHEHARATVRPDKAAAVAALVEQFRTSSATVLTEYRGLTVKQVTALRRALGDDTTYSVVKNTLTKLAAAQAGLDSVAALLEGPTAVAFVGGEPVTAAKALRDYARTNPLLVIKGGVLDGKAISPDEIRRLADLESREVLLAKMAGALKGSLSQAVYLLNAPVAQVARLAAALQAKAEQDPSVLRGGAGSPVAESPATESPATESPATESPVAQSPVVESPAAETPATESPADETTAEAPPGEAPTSPESHETSETPEAPTEVAPPTDS